MDPERLIGQLIGGFLGGKQRRRRGGLGLPGLAIGRRGYGAGRRGGGLLSAGTLLTVGGLIWGALETMQQGSAAAGAPGMPGATPAPVPPGTPPGAGSPRTVTSGGAEVAPPPPLPPIPGTHTASGESTDGAAPDLPVPPALLPLVQLAVSAARADGELSDDEVAVIRTHAAALGATALVEGELQAHRPLDAITPAFTTPEQRQMAYALAFAVMHGEGDVSPGERMYLTQLARLLALGHEDIDRIERDTLAGDASR